MKEERGIRKVSWQGREKGREGDRERSKTGKEVGEKREGKGVDREGGRGIGKKEV